MQQVFQKEQKASQHCRGVSLTWHLWFFYTFIAIAAQNV